MRKRTLFLCLGGLLVGVTIAIYFLILPQENLSPTLIPEGAIPNAAEKQQLILEEGLRQLRGELPENTYIYKIPTD